MKEHYDEPLRDIRLTRRQRRILRLMDISKSKEEIAAELQVSEVELEAELKKMRKGFRRVKE